MSSYSPNSFTEKYLRGGMPETQMELGAPDAVLHAFGFGVELVSADCVSGRFTVTERCCQPFKVLHGGVSALISEGLASMGAHVASGFQRIAGIELNINHLRAAALGEHVYAQAKPIVVGRRVQRRFSAYILRRGREFSIETSSHSSNPFAEKPPRKGDAMELEVPDVALHAFGFKVELVTADCVSGRFTVTERCCQPFKVLHGGVSALISEGLASMGAHTASGFQRVAGIELNINHLRAAALGEHVYAQAKPIVVGKRVQVWEVKLWKISATAFVSQINLSTLPEKSIMAVSRVTFLSGMPVPPSASGAADVLKRFARL